MLEILALCIFGLVCYLTYLAEAIRNEQKILRKQLHDLRNFLEISH